MYVCNVRLLLRDCNDRWLSHGTDSYAPFLSIVNKKTRGHAYRETISTNHRSANWYT